MLFSNNWKGAGGTAWFMKPDNLGEADYTRSLEHCRDKVKKLKGEYKKACDKRETTGEGRYPEWEFFNVLDNLLGPKHLTGPPTVVESLQYIGPDDESQDMSCQTTVPVVHSPAPNQISRSKIPIEYGDW